MRRLFPLALFFLAAGAAASQAEFRIDPLASQAAFDIRVLWVEHVDGHFSQVTGQIVPGPAPASGVVEATIAVDSVAMSSSRLRKWVMTPSFFDASHHPLIHFVSDPIALSELDSGGMLTGHLTLRGVTAPIHFTIEPAHCAEAAAASCKIMLRGSLKRSTFGMTADHLALSDHVMLNLDITLQRQSR